MSAISLYCQYPIRCDTNLSLSIFAIKLCNSYTFINNGSVKKVISNIASFCPYAIESKLHYFGHRQALPVYNIPPLFNCTVLFRSIKERLPVFKDYLFVLIFLYKGYITILRYYDIYYGSYNNIIDHTIVTFDYHVICYGNEFFCSLE